MIVRYSSEKHHIIHPGYKGNMKKIIISVLGKDRPGIIAAVSKLFYELECNIENVSQSILQYQFSGIFIVSAPESLSVNHLNEKLQKQLDPMHQHVTARLLESGTHDPDPITGEPFVITTKGPDSKGLVARITEIIARHGVNVTNLQAVFKGGETPGDNIMIYEVCVPEDVDQSVFYAKLREKASTLNLTISIQHRKIFEVLNRI
jgi:glycine cleavage system transcriptional repressor